MVISSRHFKATNGLKNAPEAISEGLKFKNFLGGMPPDPPTGSTAIHSLFTPTNFLEVLFCPPLSIFLNETLPSETETAIAQLQQHSELPCRLIIWPSFRAAPLTLHKVLTIRSMLASVSSRLFPRDEFASETPKARLAASVAVPIPRLAARP